MEDDRMSQIESRRRRLGALKLKAQEVRLHTHMIATLKKQILDAKASRSSLPTIDAVLQTTSGAIEALKGDIQRVAPSEDESADKENALDVMDDSTMNSSQITRARHACDYLLETSDEVELVNPDDRVCTKRHLTSMRRIVMLQRATKTMEVENETLSAKIEESSACLKSKLPAGSVYKNAVEPRLREIAAAAADVAVKERANELEDELEPTAAIARRLEAEDMLADSFPDAMASKQASISSLRSQICNMMKTVQGPKLETAKAAFSKHRELMSEANICTLSGNLGNFMACDGNDLSITLDDSILNSSVTAPATFPSLTDVLSRMMHVMLRRSITAKVCDDALRVRLTNFSTRLGESVGEGKLTLAPPFDWSQEVRRLCAHADDQPEIIRARSALQNLQRLHGIAVCAPHVTGVNQDRVCSLYEFLLNVL